jgi:hypothetical protein
MDGDGAGVGTECSVLDCDDREPLARPGGEEVCDGIDNDCNGLVDDSPECSECDPDTCVPGTMVCLGNDVVACVRGPDDCGIADVLTRCLDGQVCQDASCGPYVCNNDRQEPNDTQEDAGNVAALDGISGQLCRGDVDWFSLGTIQNGDWIEVGLEPVGPEGDLDLALVFDREIVARSETAGARESVRAQAAADTAAWFVVQGHSGAAGAYSAHWTVTGFRDCDDDRFEPNDAHVVPAPLNATSDIAATACPGDDDWYGPLTVTPGDSLMIIVTDEDFQGDLEATLVDPESLSVVHRSVPSDAGQTLAFVSRDESPFLLRVRGRDVLSFGDYAVRVVVVGPRACSVDPAEPNDSPDLAGPVTQTAFLCAADIDWYSLGHLVAGTEVSVDVVGTGFDPDLELYAGQQLVAVGTGPGREESIHWRVPVRFSAEYRVRASAWGAWFGPYTLDVTTEVPPACVEDDLEPNDLPSDATGLARDEPRDGVLCRGSVDWFQLDGVEREREGDRLIITAEHGANGEDVVLRLFEHGLQAASGAAFQGGTLIDLPLASGAHSYRLQMTAHEDVEIDYRASWSVVGSPPCEDDDFEPNNTREDASGLARGELALAQTCQDDPDWFGLTGDAPTPGQTVRAHVAFRHADGDIDAHLFHGETQVSSGTSVSDDEVLTHTVPEGEAQPYTLHVFGYNGTEAPYSVTFTVEDPE